MKWKAATLRTFTSLHSWVGLMAGFALFVAFYAGSLTIFHQAIGQWATAPNTSTPATSLSDAQHMLDAVLARHAEARKQIGMTFPGYDMAQPAAYWQDSHGTWLFATPGHVAGSTTLPQSPLPELINELHYTLGIPGVGIYLMGIVSLLYGVALVSGLVIHLPRLVKDLFALRPGRNLKRFWQDAHNVIGVFSLPFHIVFAVTGALLCLLFVLMMALSPLAFDGKLIAASTAAMDTAPAIAEAHVEKPLASLADWRERAIEIAGDHGIPDFQPDYLKLSHAGDANAVIEITGSSLRGLGAGSVAMNAATGKVLATQLPGGRDANHATLAAAYTLHFGDYGNAAVRWLYFLLGLGGAFLFYSGNLLWIESRRKRRQQQQKPSHMGMARATVGVCIGVCVAISATFVAAQLLPLWHGEGAEHTICLIVWAVCFGWTFLRPPVRAATELLWLAAAITALVPLVHGVVTGWWFWRSLMSGQTGTALIDLGALAMAVGFASLAHVTARRGREGEPNSVWAARTVTVTLDQPAR